MRYIIQKKYFDFICISFSKRRRRWENEMYFSKICIFSVYRYLYMCIVNKSHQRLFIQRISVIFVDIPASILTLKLSLQNQILLTTLHWLPSDEPKESTHSILQLNEAKMRIHSFMKIGTRFNRYFKIRSFIEFCHC